MRNLFVFLFLASWQNPIITNNTPGTFWGYLNNKLENGKSIDKSTIQTEEHNDVDELVDIFFLQCPNRNNHDHKDKLVE